MSAALVERPPAVGPVLRGRVAARRAVIRWGWRLLRREWRQQLLILALVVVAVAATVVGATVATNSPAPAGAGFGTAQDRVDLPGGDPRLSTVVSNVEQRFGRADVIENETLPIPGSVDTFELRAQDPHGAFGGSMLSLVRGRYPSGAHQTALSSALASSFGAGVGSTVHEGGRNLTVTGIVEDPQSLLDKFALVAPGQVPAPTTVTVLFDAGGRSTAGLGAKVLPRSQAIPSNAFNPETISLAGLTIGMILIALVAVGGFTVLAQRRLRSLGMLASLGATDRQVGLVVRANGLAVGVVGSLVGAVAGILLWLAYRPRLESSSHHRIAPFALPWLVVALAVVLAVVAAYVAARRPARAVTRIPVVAALSGRPPAPRAVRRSAVPGIVVLVAAFLVLGWSGSQAGQGNGNSGAPQLVIGLVLLIPGVVLLSPFLLSAAARLGRSAPLTVRLALRDLARYRARAGSALSAISIGVLIAVIIAIVAAARYGNVLDYAGPNLASDQLVLHSDVQNGPPGTVAAPAQIASESHAATALGGALGARHVVELDSVDVGVDHSGGGRTFNGQIYAATPQLLAAFGIPASAVHADADILTSRPGFSGVSGLALEWCKVPMTAGKGTPGPGGGVVFDSTCPSSGRLAHPVVQELGALPTGVSAPNFVITEHAIRTLGLRTSPTDWLVETTSPITASQVRTAQQAAAAAGMSAESKNDAPSSAEVENWATVFGIALALAILAMSVGLIRSETARDLRTLTATGAGAFSRRALTAATAGALGFLGALLGTVAGYVGVVGWIRSNALEGGIAPLGHVPVPDLLFVLVGMPLVAVLAGFLLGGREPKAMAHQPIE
ncbi:MAG: FtsX-like permease family protein [Acidobacteriota bacterium]|nr:FtsX-like permease family protein [Acidobacteriota bacterium]